MSDLVCFPPEGEWSALSPLRILSFDIECAGRKGLFPEARFDPVIQIGVVLSILGEENPTTRAVFTVRSCGSITGANVCSYETEEEMLMAWRDFFSAVRPNSYSLNFRRILISLSDTTFAISTLVTCLIVLRNWDCQISLILGA